MNKQIVGYVRLSSKEQTKGQALNQQINRVKEFGASEIYFDIDSGKKNNRKDFIRLLKDVEANKVEKIICTRLDRFSRDVLTAIQTVTKFYNEYNIQFQFTDEPELNLDDSEGIFTLNLKAALAQRESDNISARVKQGKDYQRKQGLVVATRPPYGYLINENRKYKLDRTPLLCLLRSKIEISKADIAKDLVITYIQTKNAAQTVKQINSKYGYPDRVFKGVVKKEEQDLYILNKFGLTNWLSNPVLRGHTAHKKANIKDQGYYNSNNYNFYFNTHPDEKLINEKEWELLSSILEIKAKVKNSKEELSNYIGILYCSECKNILKTRCSHPKYQSYYCKYCNNNRIKEEIVSSNLMRAIFKKAINPSENKISTKKSEQLLILEKRLARTIEALKEDPTDSCLLKNKVEYELEIKQELDKEKVIEDTQANNLIKNPILKDLGFLYCLNKELRVILFNKLIKKVYIKESIIENIIFKCN